MDTILRDVRYAVRGFLRAPGFTTIVVLTLAVGIGFTVAVFSVVNAVLVRPLPYADGDRIAIVWETFRQSRGGASPGHFHEWSERATVFEATAAIEDTSYNLEGDAGPERIRAMRVTFDYFRVAYIPPVVGRYFIEQDGLAGEQLVVLSEGLWETRFGRNPSIVGRTVRLSGTPVTVIGVAPTEYALTDPARVGVWGGFSTQAWTLLVFSPQQRVHYGSHYLDVLAKLKPGTTRDAAQADVERVTREIVERDPANMVGRGVNLQLLAPVLTGNVRSPLLLLFGAVALVLLIGCVNIGGLLLARATARRREIAIRASLGGHPVRIVRQLLTESAALALAGGAVSLVVAYVGVRFFVEKGPQNVPRMSDAGLQPIVLLTGLTTLIFGLAPAIRAGRTNLQRSLHPTGEVASSGSSRDRLRSLMVTAQICIAAVLLVAMGLLVRSALNVQKVVFGVDTENVLTARLSLPTARYEGVDAVTGVYRRILEEIRAIPGVSFAGASTNVPLGPGNIDTGITAEGRIFPPGSAPSPNIRLVSEDYFEAIGMPIVRGRAMQASDMANGAAPVAVINERLATTLWPGEDPIGKHISGWTTEKRLYALVSQLS